MPNPQTSEQIADDKSALDAIAELFRLPDWRIDDSRVSFLHAVADILHQVRDLSCPPSTEVLEEHGWAYNPERDLYEHLVERQMYAKDCDFCDRRFYPDESGDYHGISGALREDPDDPDPTLVQDICDLCKAERPPGMWPEQLNT